MYLRERKKQHHACPVSSSGPSVQPAGEVPEAPHRVHQPAAAGAGEPVQAQQIPVQAEALWSGHVADADGNTGEAPASKTFSHTLKIGLTDVFF